jgi:hypothetical protein
MYSHRHSHIPCLTFCQPSTAVFRPILSGLKVATFSDWRSCVERRRAMLSQQSSLRWYDCPVMIRITGNLTCVMQNVERKRFQHTVRSVSRRARTKGIKRRGSREELIGAQRARLIQGLSASGPRGPEPFTYLSIYKRHRKWCSRASVQAWTCFIQSTNTFCRFGFEMFAVIAVVNSVTHSHTSFLAN